jgi:photosystem II stability/assembly factor-like uncharacterized protein
MTWNTPRRFPSANRFPSVGYLDASHWWMADGLNLYHTGDAGLTWQKMPSTFPAGLSRISAIRPVNSLVLIAMADLLPEPAYLLLRSTDGGATWSIVKMPVAT